jgi:endo-1,4-beta-xylanase
MVRTGNFGNPATRNHNRTVTGALGEGAISLKAEAMTLFPAIRLLGFLAALSILGVDANRRTLREQAEQSGRLIGAAARSSQLNEPLYAMTLAREFNLLEPEDELKWEIVHPDVTRFDFVRGDRLVMFARMHGLKVRGHTLVWHHQIPPWLADGQFSPAQLHHLLEDHIRTVMEHYRGQVFAWDVVNEAFDENGQLRSTIWSSRPGIGVGTGTAYIETALRWAHAADPDAHLFLNDAECETVNRKSDAMYRVLQDFKQRRVPLDGIGFQMHVSDLNPDFSGIAANIRRFAALGFEVQITEMDVAVPVDASGRPWHLEDVARQAEIYRKIAAICFSEARCTALQMWGFTDQYSWIRSSTHGAKGAALPFDSNYAPKAAYFGLRDGLAVPSAYPPKEPALIGSRPRL